MRHRHQPATAELPTQSPVYDWARFGRHRLRAVSAVLLDHPLGPVGWVATAWVDRTRPGGWNHAGWPAAPTGGWVLPSRLALGDVIDFGTGSDRWVGIVDSYDPAGWLTLQGPYPDLAAAATDAERLLAADRYLPAVEPQRARREPRPCARRRQRPGRHP